MWKKTYTVNYEREREVFILSSLKLIMRTKKGQETKGKKNRRHD